MSKRRIFAIVVTAAGAAALVRFPGPPPATPQIAAGHKLAAQIMTAAGLLLWYLSP